MREGGCVFVITIEQQKHATPTPTAPPKKQKTNNTHTNTQNNNTNTTIFKPPKKSKAEKAALVKEATALRNEVARLTALVARLRCVVYIHCTCVCIVYIYLCVCVVEGREKGLAHG